MDGIPRNPGDACRLCLSTENTHNIFSVPDLAEKILAYLSIPVTNGDRLSILICTACIKNVNQWHLYKESCLRSQEKLQEWLLTQPTCSDAVIHVKEEPVDIEFHENSIEVVPEVDSVDNSIFSAVPNGILDATSERPTVLTETAQVRVKDVQKLIEVVPEKPSTPEEIKRENEIHDSDRDSLDTSDATARIVFNPLSKNARPLGAGATEKLGHKMKRRSRRTRTHFRGIKQYKRKCDHCKIHLHSKHSYVQHMDRFHSSFDPVSQTFQDTMIQNLQPATHSMNSSQLLEADGPKVVPVKRSVLDQSFSVLENENMEDDVEAVEDVEEELMNMEKDATLTQVQQNIISQLKTYSCYPCKQYFEDRRSTLNHIRMHMPDLRPYTCIACLMEFGDRTMYKQHCNESFECATKIALVVPKFGVEKYFTCNMCLRPMANRQELLNHLQKHSQYGQTRAATVDKSATVNTTLVKNVAAFSTMDVPWPFEGGNPKHNHPCDLCGMIYKRLPNLERHREVCLALKPEARVSYRCVHCGLSFLVFKKFTNHVITEHKKRKITCHLCSDIFNTPEEYLEHNVCHKGTGGGAVVNGSTFKDEHNFPCALCSESFTNHTDLAEHRNLHLKVKIYSCVICRCMFSSAAALEAHMNEHGVRKPADDDMGSPRVLKRSHSDLLKLRAKCPDCDKTFANINNVKRHASDSHNIKYYTCNSCCLYYKKREELEEHYRTHHEQTFVEETSVTSYTESLTPKRFAKKPLLQCPKCPKTFTYPAYMNQHCISVHGVNYNEGGTFECNICERKFKEESSLNVHKGWHVRFGNTRVGLDTSPQPNSPSKPATARKSFPKPSLSLEKEIQCQVCDDSFADVAELRKHVWNVHCSQTAKQEKPFLENELQCDLCTNVFMDERSLEEHMTWHNHNPILAGSQSKSVRCEPCGRTLSDRKSLHQHKKFECGKTQALMAIEEPLQIKGMFMCKICSKGFASATNLKKHNVVHREDFAKTKKEVVDTNTTVKKKFVKCHTCYKTFMNMRVLYHHRQIVHGSQNSLKKGGKAQDVPVLIPQNAANGFFKCNLCEKSFPSLAPLRQHFTIKHIKTHQQAVGQNQSSMLQLSSSSMSTSPSRPPTLSPQNVQPKMPNLSGFGHTAFICPVATCGKSFPSNDALQLHEENSHTNVLYSCNLCERHYFNKSTIVKHVVNTHKAVSQANGNKDNFFMETDLTTYEIAGLRHNRECPRCKVKYPNTKALKIHYFKFHERGN